MTKKEILSAVERNRRVLEEHGLLVLDKIASLPTQGEPFISHNLVVGLNIGGTAHVEYDTQPVDFRPNDMFVLMPKHTVNILQVSDDLEIIAIVVSPEKFDRMKHDYPNGYHENLHYHWQAHIQLTESQAADVHALMSVMHSVCWSESQRKVRLYHHLMEALFVLLQDYCQADGLNTHKPSPHEMILAHFVDAVMEHYTESREVLPLAQAFLCHHQAAVRQERQRLDLGLRHRTGQGHALLPAPPLHPTDIAAPRLPRPGCLRPLLQDLHGHVGPRIQGQAPAAVAAPTHRHTNKERVCQNTAKSL